MRKKRTTTKKERVDLVSDGGFELLLGLTKHAQLIVALACESIYAMNA